MSDRHMSTPRAGAVSQPSTRPAEPRTAGGNWTNEHGVTFREVQWEQDGKQWKTGVREEVALAIVAEAAAPAGLDVDWDLVSRAFANATGIGLDGVAREAIEAEYARLRQGTPEKEGTP